MDRSGSVPSRLNTHTVTHTEASCWREAIRACIRTGDAESLVRHLAGLREDDREMLLEGIGSEELRAQVSMLLRQRQEQLALA